MTRKGNIGHTIKIADELTRNEELCKKFCAEKEWEDFLISFEKSTLMTEASFNLSEYGLTIKTSKDIIIKRGRETLIE